MAYFYAAETLLRLHGVPFPSARSPSGTLHRLRPLDPETFEDRTIFKPGPVLIFDRIIDLKQPFGHITRFEGS